MTSFDEIVQEKKKSFKKGFLAGSAATAVAFITLIYGPRDWGFESLRGRF